ncbi:MAG: hypothetical protein JSU87_12565 [Gemmatimonadota bacterium]|nr:MAG: hypothetical protein JSU87_12565 [Gemmatimonadota bacterium]
MPKELQATFAAFILVFLSQSPAAADAQQIPRDEYVRYVPLEVPRIIRQTPASERLHLYGDREKPYYTDVAPVDGVDDRRHRVLHDLAVRFAPFLVQNSEGIPVDHKKVWGGAYPLYVDTWNTAMGLDLTRQETVKWMEASAEPCTGSNPLSDDCRLLELLRKYNPDDPLYAAEQSGAQEAPHKPFEVLWVDMPGSDPKSWKDHWRNNFSRKLRSEYRALMKTYVHPFLEDVRSPDGHQGVQLVLQYWFIYPDNDGGNNHEGDWEHIHVIVTPKRLVERPAISEADMRRLLSGQWLDATDENQLVMKRVEYYFHSKVASLDFGLPNAYAPRDEWKRQADSLGVELSGEELFRKYVRHMAWRDEAETEINTHPVGYIGADNKGLDQLLSAPGGTNRDSHGTYFSPGLFKDIGPAGASETISNYFDHQEYFAGDKNTLKRIDRFERGGVIFLGEPRRVEVVPDYERVIDLVLTDAEVRQEWSWLVLPLRWGYPAVESPFAGVVPHAETGNLSVVGPAFNSGWNRSGQNVQYKAYVPQVLPRMFPTGLQDAFANDWGYFNATAPALSFLPPFDILWRVIAAPVRLLLSDLDPTMYPQETIPFRFVGLDAGVSLQDVPNDYQELFYNPDQTEQILVAFLLHAVEQGFDSTTTITNSIESIESVTAPLFRVQLFIGDRLTTTNSLIHFRSQLSNTLEFNNIDDFTLTGELNWWEYIGSLRYSILTGSIQPYVKGGYGLSWYRLENVSTNGQPIEVPNSKWVRQPKFFENLLPNTWHIGAGLELLTIKGYGGLPGGLDLGLSAEWLLFTNKLGVDETGVAIEEIIRLGVSADDLPRERWIGRNVVNLTATLSY